MKKGVIYLMLAFAATLQMGCGGGGGGGDGGGGSSGDFDVVITKPQLPVNAGATVTLDASATTHTGDGVTITGFSWVQKTGTSVTLQSADTAIATFDAPSAVNTTDLTFDVVITASNGTNTTRTTTVTVIGTNQPPIANAGSDRSVNSGASVSLNGSGSSDPDAGDSIASYSWTQTGGTNVSLQNADTATASFTAPTVTSATTLTFQLTVTDTNNAQDTATVTITVNPSTPKGPFVPITRTDSNNDFVSLDVIDTMNPSNIITVEQSAFTYFHQFVQYEFDQTTKTIHNGQPKYMLYLSNGHFWRVSLAAGSDLIPQQVSSDTFSAVCGDISSPNSQLDPLDSAIIIETAGANGDCNDIQQVSDNVRRVIRLGFDASTAAIDATAIFYSLGVEVLDDGFLAVSGNTIKRYDVNLANPVDITTVTDPEAVWFSEKSEDTQFVFMDGELRAINLTNNTLNASGSLWTMTAQFPPSLDCDMSTCYFVERQGDDTLTIFQVAVSGASAATPLLGGIGDVDKNINGVNLTANYIFYTVRDANAVDELFRYPKAPAGGDAPVSVDSADQIPLAFTSRNTLFYYSVTNVTANSVSTKAGIVDEAMTNPQEFADSAWIGQGDLVLSYADGSMDGAMFLANAATDVNFGVGGAILQSYSISSGALLSTIGEIPPEISSLNLFNTTLYGDNRFAAVATESQDTTLGYQYDMYLINPNATDIFTNITNTSNQFEGNPELF